MPLKEFDEIVVVPSLPSTERLCQRFRLLLNMIGMAMARDLATEIEQWEIAFLD
jgi:hypothetical protein